MKPFSYACDKWYGWPSVEVPKPLPTLDPFEESVLRTFNEARALLLSKHQDYGPKNIANAPGGPLNGILVRLYDKIARLENLTATGAKPNHESLRDTLIDVGNFGIIGVLVVDGNWPKT